MIPEKLSFTNFMCYRQATVDFSGIHVTCLVGENGAGKSALLDGITWALWGKSRAKRDDELIHLGQSEMAVEMTFSLGPDTYRVVRKRKGGRRGSTLLDFQVRSPASPPVGGTEGGKWRSIAESSIRATEEKIARVLRLDYDTFINSAFLRQGRADEFTIKTPAERKRLLGEILGLDEWAVYEERAKGRLRQVEGELAAVNLRLEEIAAELARRPEYEAALEAAQAEVAELGQALQQAQTAFDEIQRQRTELRHTEAQLAELARRLVQARQELAALAEEWATRQARLAEYELLLAQAGEIVAGYMAYQEAVARERALGAKLAQSLELAQRKSALEARIAEARHKLDAGWQMLGQRVKELEGQTADAALVQEYEQVQAQVLHLTRLAESREAARNDLAQIAQQEAELRARNEALKVEMGGIKEKIELLEQAGADCPLCGEPLSEENRLRLVAEFQAEGTQKGDAYRSNQAALQEMAQWGEALRQQVAEADRELRGLPGLQWQVAALAQRMEAAEQAARALKAARAELDALAKRLAEGDYAPDARVALASMLAQAERLGYDAAAHEAARRAVVEGEPFAARKAQLDAARAGAEGERAALKHIVEGEKRWQAQIATDELKSGELQEVAAELRERLKEAPAVEAELQRVRSAEAQARQRLGAAQQRLESCKALEQQQREKTRRRDELAREKSIYEELRTAFGVKGVPAMIIEAAVPEIEAEANRLLARMTDGRMHVRFDTQRETLKGETRETLEIKIADELGTRPYELFSGGENFRINFAIRIALSRLLARRAGAQLRTLVIDEGFGTQDAQGRERLVEAIHAIQEDFDRILVITHIEELKDGFPARIEVTKTAEGSVVEIM